MIYLYLAKAFVFVWHRGRGLLSLSIGIHLLEGLLPGFALWVSKNLINAVSGLILSNNHNYRLVIFLLVVQFLLGLVSTVAQNSQNYITQRLTNRLEHDLLMQMAEKTTSCPVGYFELPEFFNRMNRTANVAGQRFLAPITSAMNLGRSVVTIISLLTFLLTVHWGLVVLSVLSAIPTYWVQTRLGKQKYSLFFQMTPIMRELAYLTQLFREKAAAKEIRLFNLAPHLLKRWSTKHTINADEMLHEQRRVQVAAVSLDSISGFFYAAAAIVIIWLLKKTTISIGAFVTVGQGVSNMQSSINQFSMQLAKLFEESLYIQEYFTFLEFEAPELAITQGVQPFQRPLRQGVRVENLTYRYPGGNRDILHHVSFSIQPGEKIAIVGENGSGKTTLVKCLMGLYQVTGGNIYFDDLEIREINLQTLHDSITVIFQDFMRYSFSLRDNILFGNIHASDNEQAFLEAAATSGAQEIAMKLKDGYETQLGRFLSDGEDLSGGQWQKVALARALFRQGELLILDEPTAALDPLAESEVFEQFGQLSHGRTTIFISHRMSAAKMADRILVLKDGAVVESGTHEQLMELNQEYSHMYQMQASWFAD